MEHGTRRPLGDGDGSERLHEVLIPRTSAKTYFGDDNGDTYNEDENSNIILAMLEIRMLLTIMKASGNKRKGVN